MVLDITNVSKRRPKTTFLLSRFVSFLVLVLQDFPVAALSYSKSIERSWRLAKVWRNDFSPIQYRWNQVSQALNLTGDQMNKITTMWRKFVESVSRIAEDRQSIHSKLQECSHNGESSQNSAKLYLEVTSESFRLSLKSSWHPYKCLQHSCPKLMATTFFLNTHSISVSSQNGTFIIFQISNLLKQDSDNVSNLQIVLANIDQFFLSHDLDQKLRMSDIILLDYVVEDFPNVHQGGKADSKRSRLNQGKKTSMQSHITLKPFNIGAHNSCRSAFYEFASVLL